MAHLTIICNDSEFVLNRQCVEKFMDFQDELDAMFGEDDMACERLDDIEYGYLSGLFSGINIEQLK